MSKTRLKNTFLWQALLAVLLLLGGCAEKEQRVITDIATLPNAKLGVLIGSMHVDLAQKQYPDAEIQTYDNYTDMLYALRTRKVDALIEMASGWSAQEKDVKDVAVLNDRWFVEQFGMIFNKNNPDLLAQYNTFLKELKESGEWQKIVDRWYDSKAEADMPDLSNVPRSGKPLRVACTGTMAFYDFVKNGVHSGYDIEIVERFAAYLGRPVEYIMMNFGGLIAAVSTDVADIGTSSICITEERAKQVNFSDCYGEEASILLIRKENTAEAVAAARADEDKERRIITDLAQEGNVKVGLMVGTTHVDYLKEDYPEAEQHAFDNISDVFHALRTHKVDAISMDISVWKGVASEYTDMQMLLEHWRAEQFGMIFNKENTELLAQYNTFLKELKESGTHQQILDKWYADVDKAEMVDLSHIARSGKPLTVACTGTTATFDFIKDGKNVGIDIEIIEHFAAWLGRPVEYKMMNFGGMIAAVSSNVTEMGSSSMCITAERAKMVNFGDPYDQGWSSIIIRKENAPVSDGLMSHKDLKGGTLGTLLGSTQDEWVKARYTDYKQLVMNNKADLLNALSSGQCDAIILDAGTQLVLDENADIAVLEEGFCPVDLAVCFQKDAPLAQQYNDFQRKLQESGELEKLVQKWLLHSDSQPAVEFEKFPGKPLRLGTTLMEQPYSFVKDGKPSGFDLELISLFAKSIGRSVKVVPYDFGGLIAALSTGAIDLAANSIMVTPERSKEVTFAQPYHRITSNLIVRTKDLSPQHPNARVEQVEEKSFWQGICESFENNLIKEQRWKLIVEGLYNTVIISIFSILFGSLMGCGVCAMRMSRKRLLRGTAIGFIDLIRGIPVLVLLMILYYVVFAQMGLSAQLVAIITFALNEAAYTSEMYRAGLENIDPGQKKAGIAMGFTPWQTFRYIILPQTVTRVLPVFKGEAIALVKTTSIVGYIAVADLTKASDLIRSRTFDAFFPLIIITIIYFVLAWLLGKSLDLIGKSTK